MRELRVENVLQMFQNEQLHTPGETMRVLPLMCEEVLLTRKELSRVRTELAKTQKELWDTSARTLIRRWWNGLQWGD